MLDEMVINNKNYHKIPHPTVPYDTAR